MPSFGLLNFAFSLSTFSLIGKRIFNDVKIFMSGVSLGSRGHKTK